MIFKLQRPLYSQELRRPWLFYNKDRTWEGTVPDVDIPQALRDAMGDDMKAYFEGKPDAAGKLHLTSRVKNQDW